VQCERHAAGRSVGERRENDSPTVIRSAPLRAAQAVDREAGDFAAGHAAWLADRRAPGVRADHFPGGRDAAVYAQRLAGGQHALVAPLAGEAACAVGVGGAEALQFFQQLARFAVGQGAAEYVQRQVGLGPGRAQLLQGVRAEAGERQEAAGSRHAHALAEQRGQVVDE